MRRSFLLFNRDVPALVLGCILFTNLISPLPAQTAAPSEPQIPDNDRSPYHLALLAYKASHYQEALDTLGSASSADEKTAILKSRILTELGRYDEGAKLLQPLLTPTGPIEVQLALADLLLRKHDFTGASKYYSQALAAKPNDPDLLLMMVYSRIGAADLVGAAKIASTLKPLDQANPSYYFAQAAIAQSTDKTQEAENDIETARTMYGITVVNHYLKTYLEVLSSPSKNALITPTNSPATTAPSAPAKH